MQKKKKVAASLLIKILGLDLTNGGLDCIFMTVEIPRELCSNYQHHVTVRKILLITAVKLMDNGV